MLFYKIETIIQITGKYIAQGLRPGSVAKIVKHVFKCIMSTQEENKKYNTKVHVNTVFTCIGSVRK